MKDELTSAMHEEFTVDAATELMHKAACVWKLIGDNYTEGEFAEYCALYGIDSEQAGVIIRDFEMTRFRDDGKSF